MHSGSTKAGTDSELTRAVSEWDVLFSRYEPFDHFVTLTFERADTSEAQARREFARYLARAESSAGGAVAYVSALAASTSGRVHVHALLKGTRDIPVVALREMWHLGYSHAVVYDAARGARRYIAQHLSKPGQHIVGDLEIASPTKFIRAAGRRPPRKARRALRYFMRRPRGVWYTVVHDVRGRLVSSSRRVR